MALPEGTESTALAAEMALGASNLRHTVSAEQDKYARQFIEANFTPEHLYDDVCDFFGGKQCIYCKAANRRCLQSTEHFDMVTPQGSLRQSVPPGEAAQELRPYPVNQLSALSTDGPDQSASP